MLLISTRLGKNKFIYAKCDKEGKFEKISRLMRFQEGSKDVSRCARTPKVRKKHRGASESGTFKRD